MMHGQTICLWCAARVTLRRGGSPRKFCSPRCRHEFHSCARRWAEAAVAAGALSIDVLKNGDPAACTLLPRATLAVPIGEAAPQHLGPVSPRADSRFTRQQDLERLKAQAIAARRRGCAA
jgi:hypothetical protein